MELEIMYEGKGSKESRVCDKCGGELEDLRGNELRKCKVCGYYADTSGRSLGIEELNYCRGCGGVYIKRYHCVASSGEIYKCPDCESLQDKYGKMIQSHEMVECGHCKEYFNGDEYKASEFKCPPIDAYYKCPDCRHFLDKEGQMVDGGRMYKCISCNLSFSERLGNESFGLVKCISCGNYVDSEGHELDSGDIRMCPECHIVFNRLAFEDRCPVCNKREWECVE